MKTNEHQNYPKLPFSLAHYLPMPPSIYAIKQQKKMVINQTLWLSSCLSPQGALIHNLPIVSCSNFINHNSAKCENLDN